VVIDTLGGLLRCRKAGKKKEEELQPES
jgi:hypothetical protein